MSDAQHIKAGDYVRHTRYPDAGIGYVRLYDKLNGSPSVYWDILRASVFSPPHVLAPLHISNPHTDLPHLERYRPAHIQRVLSDRALDHGRRALARTLLKPWRCKRWPEAPPLRPPPLPVLDVVGIRLELNKASFRKWRLGGLL